MAHGPRKTPLDYGGNTHYFRVGVRVGLGLRLGGGTAIHFNQHLFNSNSFATSAALDEVCFLLSAIQVCLFL